METGLPVLAVAAARCSSPAAPSPLRTRRTGKARPSGDVAKGLVRAGVHADVSLIRADGTTDAFAVDRGKVTRLVHVADACCARRQGGHAHADSARSSAGPFVREAGARVLAQRLAFRVQRPGPDDGRGHSASPGGQVAGRAPGGELHPWRRLDRTGLARPRLQVTAASTTSLTIKRADGQTVTFTLGAGAAISGHLAVGGEGRRFRGRRRVRVLARWRPQ